MFLLVICTDYFKLVYNVISIKILIVVIKQLIR